MRTSVAIGVGVLVVVIIISIFWTLSFFTDRAQSNAEVNRHNEKCQAWSDRIEQNRIVIQNQLFPDTAAFNLDVNNYNAECAY